MMALGAHRLQRAREIPGRAVLPLRQVNVVASTEDIFPAYNAGFREGIGFSASDVASGNRCMVLGSRLAQRLFGDSSALGKEIIWHNEWIESPTGEIEPAPSGYVYTVIGVMEPVESSIMAKAAAELEDDPERFDFSIDGRAYIPITSAPGMEGPQSQSLRNQCRISLIERCCTCLDEVRQAIDIEYDGRLEASSAMEHMKEEHAPAAKPRRGILVLASGRGWS